MLEIEIFLNKCQTQNIDLFDVIAVQETWLDETTESLVSIPGYTFISKPIKSSKTGGGLGMFVKNNLSYIYIYIYIYKYTPTV